MNIFTREECKKLINELEIISYKKHIRLRQKRISTELMNSILFHTKKCRDDISERVYWILNNIENYHICKECGKSYQPRFYGLKNAYGQNSFCSTECAHKSSICKEKSKQTCLERYGTENAMQSKHIQEKSKQTCLQRYGTENAMQSPIIKEKSKQTCLERYGVEYTTQCTQMKEKTKQTCLERYGVEYAAQSVQMKEKSKQTCLERYGVEYSLQSVKAQEKRKLTMLEKFGVIYPIQCAKIKTKIQQTCLENYNELHPWKSEQIRKKCKKTNLQKYNTEYPNQSEIVKAKSKQTYLHNWGTTHPMKNIDFFNKNKKNQYSNKLFTLPSGEIITYQGYENVAINKLLEQYLEEEIITNTKLIPTFNYNFKDKDRTYYPDIFIPGENKIIEVKSTYTYNKDFEMNLAKKQACLDKGYQFEFWICSNIQVLEIK